MVALLRSQVARIQLGILQALTSLPPSTEVSGAIGMLNAELMDITKLYGDFAEPFGLAECKLAIVHCAGHYDPTLVESLWRDIIDNGGLVVGREGRMDGRMEGGKEGGREGGRDNQNLSGGVLWVLG